MQQMYSCPNCGAPVAFGARFCTGCGTALNWPTEQQVEPPPAYQQQQQQSHYGYGQQAPEQKKTSRLLVAFIAVIVIGALVGGGIFALDAFSQETPPVPPPATETPPPADGTPVADSIAPVITNVSVSPAETSAVITWATDESATSQVEYGTTATYGSTATSDERLVTGHSVTVGGLEPNRTYDFRVRSQDEAGNEAMSSSSSFATKSATEVGGIISSSATWTEENSPYWVTSTVQIPPGVTLTIEPGVTAILRDVSPMAGGSDMFLVHGTLSAHGTNDNRITFVGADTPHELFCVDDSGGDAFVDLDYCVIEGGRSLFWGGHGYLSLRHSELYNLRYFSYIWYPEQDVYIEHNKFIDSAGFSIGHREDVKVYIRYNLFVGKNSSLPNSDFWIQNWASYDSSETIVKYNSFMNTEVIAVRLPSGYGDAALSATENYWGTEDTSVIDAMIYDKNDDITGAGYIDYLPILTDPHPSTPPPD